MGTGNGSACSSNSRGGEAARGPSASTREEEKELDLCREFARSWGGKGSRPTDGEMERVLSASAAMLLLLSGDVETNPGPIGRSRSREPKPDPKKIMEEKVDFAERGEGPEE